jgi:hypothetical protein
MDFGRENEGERKSKTLLTIGMNLKRIAIYLDNHLISELV